MSFYLELAKEIKKRKIKDKSSLSKLKQELARKHGLKKTPSTIEISYNLPAKTAAELKNVLTSKPVRTISGVAPLALMSAPIACKHGVCIFCPGGPDSYFGDVAQSYTGHEPASRRGLRNKWDPYLQVMNRLEHYALLNQDFSKCEIILMGGTFPSFDLSYQDDFVKYIFKAMNDFSDLFFINGVFNFEKFKKFFELPANVHDPDRTAKINEKLLKLKTSTTLEAEQIKNETSNVRAVAFVIETKPDWCFQNHINLMLQQGTTRVEVGIQSIYDDILKFSNRGHDIKDGIKATQLLKDSFLKVTYHGMLGLPKSSYEKDIETYKQFFQNPDFKPDALKIYPCRVFPGTPLYNLWKSGKYKPISDEESISRIAEIKHLVPEYLRIMRVQRDIPGNLNAAGPKKTNLRQMIHEKHKHCRCIRCREPLNKEINWDKVKLKRLTYQASNGTEIFLSYEDVVNDILLGFARLRIPYKPFRPEITSKSAGIRELHVYGQATSITEKQGKVQHRGFGKKLMEEAEKIAAEEYDVKKILVISGVGVRLYYYKLGYTKDGVYVSKKLSL